MTKRKTLRERLAEAEAARIAQHGHTIRLGQRVNRLEQLVLAYKNLCRCIAVQRDLRPDAVPVSKASAQADGEAAERAVEALTRELWPELYVDVDQRIADEKRQLAEDLERKEPGKWN